MWRLVDLVYLQHERRHLTPRGGGGGVEGHFHIVVVGDVPTHFQQKFQKISVKF